MAFGMMKWEELALLTSSVAESSTDGRGLYLRLLSASGVLAILLAPASDALVLSSQLVVAPACTRSGDSAWSVVIDPCHT